MGIFNNGIVTIVVHAQELRFTSGKAMNFLQGAYFAEGYHHEYPIFIRTGRLNGQSISNDERAYIYYWNDGDEDERGWWIGPDHPTDRNDRVWLRNPASGTGYTPPALGWIQ
eukprot:11200406-Karenia_brevis.AAC.1